MKLNDNNLRRVVCLGVLLLATAPMLALAADNWLPVDGSDCTIWSDQPLKPGEAIRWSGGCENVRLAGQGALDVSVSDQRQVRFDGVMRGGKANGEGVLESREQEGEDRYTGGFADGKANGKGVYPDPIDDVFEGTWSDGKAEGEFVVTRADGAIEKQLWHNDQQVAPGASGGEQ